MDLKVNIIQQYIVFSSFELNGMLSKTRGPVVPIPNRQGKVCKKNTVSKVKFPFK